MSADRWAPDFNEGTVTLAEYRAAEAAGRITRPISWKPGRRELEHEADEQEAAA